MYEQSQPLLMVEDNPADYYAAKRALQKSGLANPIVNCSRGEEAMDYLERRGAYSGSAYQGRPGLILLDLNLPGMDGTEVLQAIRKAPASCDIPVVVLTTSADQRDVAQCYGLGASSYMQKPVSMEALVKAMQRLKDYWFEVVVLPQK